MSDISQADEPVTPDTLTATYYIDSDNPAIIEYARNAVGDETDEIEKAKKLYYAARDDFRYDPYTVDMRPEAYRASGCLERGNGFCITKAAFLAAIARAVGIPARLGYADVKNHIATQRLLDMMGTDIFAYHGYTDLHIGGKWVKATPAFNIELCEKFGVLPLEFNGRDDSIFHPFTAAGEKHMEYVNDRGTRNDLPFDEIRDAFLDIYGPDFGKTAAGGDFGAEAEAEKAAG